MTFVTALSVIFTDNKRARRRLWSKLIYCLIDDEKLCIHGYVSSGPDDGKNHPWVITSEDYFADDWEIVDA